MPLTFLRIVLMSLAICFVFNVSETFAQCGADGKQPCPKTTPKKTIPKKTTTKPTTKSTVSKPIVKKPQTKFVPRAPEIEMVRISSGSFMMGSDKYSDEKPVHRVNISNSFYMGKYEVTQAQWRAVMGNNPSKFSTCGGNCPVEKVSWNNVQDFIRKLNSLQNDYKYRLPTEAEWEYAARAGSTTKYSYGDGEGLLGNYAWYSANSENKTHPVGQKQPNAWGLYDMHGNVWEWVQNWYGPYSSGTVTNPTGAASGSNRVARGGGWFNPADHLRSASRFDGTPSGRSSNLGFRVVRN